MKDESKRLSNVFWPLFSSRFVIRKFSDYDEPKYSQYSDEDVLMQDDNLPIGLIDSIKANHAYKELVKIFRIEEVENQIALDLIDHEIIEYCSKNKAVDFEWKLEWNIDYDPEKHQQVPMTEQEIEIIMLWRTSKLSLTSIGYKTGV